MSNPLVSVVTPSYNRPKAVERAVGTVSRQTYPAIQHIIVDDLSETPVSDVVNADHVHIHRHDENQGANAARNTGIEIADGEFIAFLDDDDEWTTDKIERQVERAEQTDAGVVYTGVKQVDDGDSFAVQTPAVEGEITRQLLTETPVKTFSSVMVRSDVFDSVGLLDERLPNWQDWEFYLRASLETEFAGISEPLTSRHHDSDGHLTADYEGKRDVSAQIIREKYTSLAEEYGVVDAFNARIERALGAAAINARQYRAARGHYLRSMRIDPTIDSLIRFAALIGGGYTYQTTVNIRRKIASEIAQS